MGGFYMMNALHRIIDQKEKKDKEVNVESLVKTE